MQTQTRFYSLIFLLLAASSYAQAPFRYVKYSLEQGLPSSRVTYVGRDAQSRLWVGTSSGLALKTGDQFHKIQFNHTNITRAVIALVEDSLEQHWIMSGDGRVGCMNLSKWECNLVQAPLKHPPLTMAAYGPNILVASRYEMLIFNPQKQLVVQKTFDERIKHLIVRRDTVFVAHNQAISTYVNGEVTTHETSVEGRILNIVIDKESMLLSTHVGHVYRCALGGTPELVFKTDTLKPFNLQAVGKGRFALNGLDSFVNIWPEELELKTQIDEMGDQFNFLLNMYADNNGTIWLGTEAGLFALYPASVVPVSSPEPITYSLLNYQNIWHSVGKKGVYSYGTDGNWNLEAKSTNCCGYVKSGVSMGSIWLLPKIGALHRWAGGKIEQVYPPTGQFYFRQGLFTEENHIYFSIERDFVKITALGIDTLPELPSRAVSMTRLNDSSVLLGLIDGLCIYYEKSESYQRIGIPQHPEVVISKVSMAPDGEIYVGTLLYGLFSGWVKDSVFEIGRFSGQPIHGNYQIVGMETLEDKTWVFSSAGAECWNVETNALELSVSKSELTPTSWTHPFARQRSSGIVLGGNNGLYELGTRSEPLNVTAVLAQQTNGKTTLLGAKGSIRLEAGDERNLKLFPIEGISPNPAVQSFQLQVGTKKGGASIYESSSHFDLYNLLPGSYRLSLKAKSNAAWGEGFEINLYVAAHLWEKWWFYPLLVGAVLVVLFTLVFVWNNERKKRKLQYLEYEKERTDLRSQSFLAQMNPHFVFNALNSIQDLIFKEKTDKASQFLQKFSRLLRQTLDTSNIHISTLKDELELAERYLQLEKLRFGDGFQYHIEVDPALEQSSIEIPGFILQPLLENSLKHGILGHMETGEIKVEVSEHKGKLKLRLVDNGVGYAPSSGRKGLGLKLVKERLKLHFPKSKTELLSIRKLSETGTRGTEVVILVPLEKSSR